MKIVELKIQLIIAPKLNCLFLNKTWLFNERTHRDRDQPAIIYADVDSEGNFKKTSESYYIGGHRLSNEND